MGNVRGQTFSAPLSNTTYLYSGLKEGAPFGALFLVSSYLLPLRSSKISWLRDAGLASMAYFYFDFRDTVKQNRRSFKLLLSPLSRLSARSDLLLRHTPLHIRDS